jgi:hypothetical protein
MPVLQHIASYVALAIQRSSLRRSPVSQVLLKKRAAWSAWAWKASSQTCGQASSGCRPNTWRPMPAPCTTSLMLQLCVQLWRLPAVRLRNRLLPRQMTPKGQSGGCFGSAHCSVTCQRYAWCSCSNAISIVCTCRGVKLCAVC